MKFSCKQELQQIELDHLSHIGFEDFMNLRLLCSLQYNSLRFRKNLLGRK